MHRPVHTLFLALFMLSVNSSAPAAEALKPNIIVIVMDDLGWADLGCYGSTYHRTPQLDRLAAEGMRFTDAYAACAVCSPTRAALLTGKYPARLQLTDWLPGRPDMPAQKLLRPMLRQQLPLEEATLAELLHGAGYTTACIGKWHLGGEGFSPREQGFDLSIAANAAGSPASYFAPFERGERRIPGLEAAPAGEYLTDRLTAEAEKFIAANRDRPFFLYLPHYAVHIPLAAKAELEARYAGELQYGRQSNPIYAAMIESMDQSVGRIANTLAEHKLTERTIIVFTSDNGGLATLEGPNTPATINAPLREGKGYLYEGGIRVPLLVKWPAEIKPGTVCDTPVSSIDMLPTLLAACSVEHPAVDGQNLMPLLKQTGPLEREALYWHYPHYSNQGGRPGGAIRAGDWKLIEFFENGRRELFNVRQDRGEGTNLADKFPERVEALGAKLAAWRTAVGAQSMQPNSKYVPNPQAEDGSITLPARTAEVHGVMLRFEPLPHKNTLGYWVRMDDWASWEFQVARGGTFAVEVLQGCGAGSGGSEVVFAVGDQQLRMTVEDTGGFQKFVPRVIGTVQLEQPGRYTLSVKPQTKPGVAVMDLRQIILRMQ